MSGSKIDAVRERHLWNSRPFHRYAKCVRCESFQHTTGFRRTAMICLACFRGVR